MSLLGSLNSSGMPLCSPCPEGNFLCIISISNRGKAPFPSNPGLSHASLSPPFPLQLQRVSLLPSLHPLQLSLQPSLQVYHFLPLATLAFLVAVAILITRLRQLVIQEPSSTKLQVIPAQMIIEFSPPDLTSYALTVLVTQSVRQEVTNIPTRQLSTPTATIRCLLGVDVSLIICRSERQTLAMRCTLLL